MANSGGTSFKYVGDLTDDVISAVFNNPVKKNEGSQIKLFECDRASSNVFGHSKNLLSWAYPHGILIGGQKYRSIFDYYIIQRFEELAPGEFDDILHQLHSNPNMNHNIIRQALFKNIDRGRVAGWNLVRGLLHIQKAMLECAKQNEAFMKALMAPDNQLPILAYACSFFGTGMDFKGTVDWYKEFMSYNYVLRYSICFPLKMEDLSILPKLGKGYNVLGALYVALREKLHQCQTYGQGFQSLHVNIEPYTGDATVHVVTTNSGIFARPRRPLKRRYTNSTAVDESTSPPAIMRSRIAEWLDTSTGEVHHTLGTESTPSSSQTVLHCSPAMREAVVTPVSVMERFQLGSSSSLMSLYSSNFDEEAIPYAPTTRNSTPAKTTENHRLTRASFRDDDDSLTRSGFPDVEEAENVDSKDNITVHNATLYSPLNSHTAPLNAPTSFSQSQTDGLNYLVDFSRPPPNFVPAVANYVVDDTDTHSHYSMATTVDAADVPLMPPPLQPPAPQRRYSSAESSIEISPEEEAELLADDDDGISDQRLAELNALLDSNPTFINSILQRQSSRASSRRE